ncbi:glycosyltransferase [Ruegeria sp. HKCCD8929]|uniref:glycosyltransferase n=1 Tax=Ruegeria sp. HKCCD8929 TaxID=2683006 RepID=UPI001488D753|nr:glycosyltransferase [Ruegeria sp. HKCCD8929]
MQFRPEYLEGEIKDISYIYETAFPQHQIRLHLHKHDGPVPERAKVVMEDMTLKAQDLDADYLGLRIAGKATPEAPVVSVHAWVARQAMAEELETHDEGGIMRSWKTRALYRLSPYLLENLKYRLEKWWEAKHFHDESWENMPRAKDAFLPDPKAYGPLGCDKKPAILIGFHWLEHGGAEKLAFDTVQWALRAGLRVFVISQLDGLQRLHGRLPEEVRFVRIDRYLPEEKIAVFLRNFVLRENIRLIHNHHCVPLYQSLPTIKAVVPDVKIISSTHILEYENGGFVRLDGIWSDFIDLHHVISGDLVTLFQQKFHARDRVVLGRLLDGRDAPASAPDFPASLSGKPLTVAFIGRMVHQKRPVLLAMMMKALKRWAGGAGISLSFQIVGEGPYLPHFSKLLSRYGLSEMTVLHPASSDVPAILRASDIMLLPSANEGLALVCYEAIENGAVPISSNVGAQSELIPPELLLDRAPGTAIRQVVGIVEKLTTDAGFYQDAVASLKTRYEAISAEPTAREVLMPIYRQAVGEAEE